MLGDDFSKFLSLLCHHKGHHRETGFGRLVIMHRIKHPSCLLLSMPRSEPNVF
ncbi:unnamed protein product [Acanthoscelides obtectus]|uniref:Uncharacterized protein n=1 Tax=Acanthoscelides obtectus TaxID=200917 RepID=A0A9P0Q4L3_ACAOB|nr:unnamed protein product [Acanthoscelides obtectus]CAK1658586.1 hypothetical protein AOBTE_LOCUS21005 [Acanthoscelides obtectus]